MNTELDLTADMIDVRDVIARVEELRDERDASELDPKEYGGPNDDWKEERTELAMLESLLDELQGKGGDEKWEGNWYPVTLIADRYFEDYARELAEDIGAIDKAATWPNTCIDWEKAAKELANDYASIDIGENSYYYI